MPPANHLPKAEVAQVDARVSERLPAAFVGQGFSPDTSDNARSATSEEARGNPGRVSPASSLENAWIEIFRAGDYGERGRWTEAQLDQLAADYDPRRHAAPVVLGHPADDAPAYAWVKRLRRASQSLWAQLEKVDPLLEALLRAGRFAQRSVALYTNFPATGGPYLRHLGFLGAAPPAVKGLAPVRPARRSLGAGGFADAASVTFAFDDQFSEVSMSEPKSKLEAFLDHLRAFFTAPPESGLGRAGACLPPEDGRTQGPALPEPSGGEVSFAERLATVEERLEALTGSSSEPVTPSEAGGRAEGSLLAHQHITAFVDSLRVRGRFPPAFERWGVAEFMERLAAADAAEGTDKNVCPTAAEDNAVILSEAKDRDEEAPPSLLAWFQEFLTKLPAVIEFGELGEESSHGSRVAGPGSRLVRFTEPHRGMSIDPASVELAERAEALAVQLGISYAEALTRLREENRRTVGQA